MPRQSIEARIKRLEDLVYLFSGGGNNPLVTQSWINAAAGATAIPAGPSKILADPTAGNVVLSFAGGAAPLNQSIILIKDSTGQSQIHPITLAAPTEWTIEMPQNQGNFGATASMTSQGGAWAFQADATVNKLFLVWTA